MALITCEGSSESARHAEPDEAQMPSLSSRMSSALDSMPWKVMFQGQWQVTSGMWQAGRQEALSRRRGMAVQLGVRDRTQDAFLLKAVVSGQLNQRRQRSPSRSTGR
jgi:hypothetical protein